MTKFEVVTPRLPVSDVEQALAFYVDKLGFELGWKWAIRSPTRTYVATPSLWDLIASAVDRQGTAMAYVELSGVDDYFLELKGRDVVLSDIADRP